MAGQTLKPFDGQLDSPSQNLTPFTGELDAPDAPKRSALDVVKDFGVTALKGAVGLPQSVVGLADMATGGRAGKALEQAGVGFEETQKFLDDQYSDAQKAANRKVQTAQGFVGTAKAMLENPSTIATSVGESVPQMLGGAGVARGLLKVAPKVAPAIAGAIGEGVLGAGSQAEQIRQETQDGLLTPKQVALSAATGASTAAFGALGGKLSQRLGIGDADTMLAQGAIHGGGPASQRSLARQVGAGVLSEGVLEEVPQSMSEQALQNLALDKPVGEGVGAAAAQGLLAGGAMGGGAALLHGAGAAREGRRGELGTQPAPGDQLSLLPTNEVPASAPATVLPTVVGGVANVQRTFDPRDPASRPPLDVMPTAPTDGVPFDVAPADTSGAFSTGGLALAEDPQPVRPSEAMGLDPAVGPLSTAAALAVDSGAHDAMNEAARAAVQPEEGASKVADSKGSQTEPAGVLTASVAAASAPQDRAAELRERIDFVRKQAAANGWDQRLIAERDRAQAELAAMQAAQPLAPTSLQEGIAQARARRGTTAQTTEAAPSQVAAPDSSTRPAALDASGVAVDQRQGEAVGPQATHAQQARAPQAAPGKETSTASALTPAPAVPNAKREKAVRRVEEGRAWFLSGDKARAFVQESGLADTHEVVPDNRRFVVRAKAGAPESAVQVPVQTAGTNLKDELGEGVGTFQQKLDARIADAKHQVGQARSIAPKLRDVNGVNLGALEAEASRLESRRVEAKALDDAALREDAGRGLLKSARQELDASNLTPEQRVDAVQRAADTGNAVEASQTILDAVDHAANQAATSSQNDLPEPSQAQKEAGNYKGGHLSGDDVQGLRISVENPQGSTRSGTSPDGTGWSNTMAAHYGYVKGTEAADGDHVDVFVGPHAATAPTVYVVDQVNADGSYDEAKALFGFNTEAEAVAAYKGSYDADWTVGPITPMSVDEFKAGLAAGRFKKALSPSLQPVAKPARDVLAKMQKAKVQRETKAARAAREAEEARATYFTPGNVVRGYSGFDRVINYQPVDSEGQWSVTVHEVRKIGPATFEDVPDADARTHSTQPDARAMKTGPAGRMEPPEAAMPAPQPVETGEPAPVPAAIAQRDEKIVDFGEKIGGARKDRAEKTGARATAAPKDERPAWARRFQVSQITKSRNPLEEGRWVIRDTRSLDFMKQPRQVGRDNFATREEAEAAIPLAAVSLKHRPVHTRDGKFEIWRDVTDRKRVKVVERAFESREDALRYIAENARTIIETNTTFGEADLPRPVSEQRVGVERRTGDVKDGDFGGTFGFRGVEFGNWNNQADRQQLLNDAYDGLLDLAEVMGIPPRAISLNGELALAFGARGSGLSGARAHYESAKAVINLTKMNGAGSLAHEWFHAMDHYFGRQDGKSSTEWVMDKDGTRSLQVGPSFESEAASGGLRGERSGVRAEVRQAYDGLMQTIAKKAEHYVEDTANADRFVARAREGVQQRLADIRTGLAQALDPRYFKRNNKPATAEQLAEFDTVAQQILDGVALDLRLGEKSGKSRGVLAGVRWTNDALEKVSAIMKAARGRNGFGADGNGPLDKLRGDMQLYSARLKMLAEAQLGSEKTRMVPTQFAMDAKELDQGRGTDYWTTPHEMAARAFQGYVEDKIAERGGASPFLNFGPENVGIPTPWGFKRPFPHGAERVAINKALDRLVEVIQTREGEGGNVALFRRSDDGLADLTPEVANAMRALSRPSYSPEARAQAVASVSKTVEAIRTAWANGPEVVVAFDMNDPVVPERARHADLKQRSGGARGAPEGFYYRGKAYLMASRLPRAEDAARVLYHEVLGHHGLRGRFGKQLDDVLNQIATMRRPEVDAKIREYGLRGVNKLDRRAAAEEVLAEMAQRTPELHFVRRAVAAIRSWLRQHVPGFRGLRLTDDEIIRNFILPARQFVERGAGAAASDAGPTFSRAEDASAPQRRASTFAEARAAAKAFQGAPLLNIETGMQAVVSRNSLDKMLSAKSVSKSETPATHAMAVANADSLFQQAILGWSKPDRGNDPNVRAIHRFFAPIEVDGRMKLVKLTVKENAKVEGTNPLYTVEAVELNDNVPGRQWVESAAREDGLVLDEKNPLQREWADEIASDAGPRSALAQPRGVNPGRSAEDLISLAEQIERGNVAGGEADDADIMFSRSKVAGYARTAAAELNKTFSAPGTLSWWHKTVGTMYNLAERSPAFKSVFEAAQGFVDDVSFFANDAAELAPKLLPKLETWRDIKKSPVAAADNKAVAKPVFEGTLTWARDEQGSPVQVQTLIDAAASLSADQKAQRLLRNGHLDERMLKAWKGMPLESYEKAVGTRFESRMLQPGVVWSDAELRSMFQLTDGQIGLYREFRQSTDRSLDTMARADMLRFAGDDAKGLRGIVMDAPDAQAAAVLIRDHLVQLAGDQPDRATMLLNTANGVIERADKVRDLQARGYAPLSRFGRFTVDVVDVAGERQYFGLFETAREANAMAARIREEFGEAGVSQGTLSEEAFKLFAGVTPETLELFGNALGLDSTGDSAQDQAFQEYLKLTKTNRSAMRRLIHRKGIAGFSDDVGRVLAAFVYSNARQTAAGLHMGDLGEAVTAIPKEQGELKDAAVRLAEYVKNPQEEAQAVRGLLFAQYLGGSVASALVNALQPVQVTFPWLSQYGGAKAAAAQIGRAAKDLAARGRNYEPDLAAALKRAEAEGVVAPQEVHQLMAQARGAGSLRSGDGTRAGDLRALGQNALSRVSLAWGKVFGAAEQLNRRITFIAAYRTAKTQGMADPAGFARQAITETQFLYSKANKMEWGRGAVGGTLMTFKTYSVAYLELLHRMYSQGGPEGKRAALLALGMLMLMGGAGGLPFAEDLEDAADGLAQMLGYNFSAKKSRQEFLESMLPRGIAQFIDKGVSGLPGAPLDVSGRLGMGNLIPGTGLLLEKTSHARDVLEIAGPAGDFASRILSGGRSVLTGDVGAGVLEMSPTAVRNAVKGTDMAATGMYRDAKGYKVLDTNHLEAAMKAIGFQPGSVATIQEANRISQGAKAFYNLRAQDIRALWAQGIFEGDQDKVQAARDQVAAWNQKNPDQPMQIRIPDVMRRVREMRKTKDERIADTAPRAMRALLREDAARARSATSE